MFALWHETRKTNFGMREQKKIGHPGNEKCAICAIIQSNLYKQRGLAWEIRHRCCTGCSHILRSFSQHRATGTKEKPRLDASIEDNPRVTSHLCDADPMRYNAMRNVASRRSDNLQIVGVCWVKIYDAPEIFHYRFSWTSRCAARAHMYTSG